MIVSPSEFYGRRADHVGSLPFSPPMISAPQRSDSRRKRLADHGLSGSPS